MLTKLNLIKLGVEERYFSYANKKREMSSIFRLITKLINAEIPPYIILKQLSK